MSSENRISFLERLFEGHSMLSDAVDKLFSAFVHTDLSSLSNLRKALAFHKTGIAGKALPYDRLCLQFMFLLHKSGQKYKLI